MKKYKVEMFSEGLDMEMNVRTVEEASVVYMKFRNSKDFNRGHIVDNETGEVYAMFEIINFIMSEEISWPWII